VINSVEEIGQPTKWLDGSSSNIMCGFLKVIFAKATLLFWPPSKAFKKVSTHTHTQTYTHTQLTTWTTNTIPDKVYMGWSARFPVTPKEPKWPRSFCSGTPCRKYQKAKSIL
jgi:hypothetical protein